MQQINPDSLYKIGTLMEVLGISRAAIIRYLTNKQIHGKKFGRDWKVLGVEILYIRENGTREVPYKKPEVDQNYLDAVTEMDASNGRDKHTKHTLIINRVKTDLYEYLSARYTDPATNALIVDLLHGRAVGDIYAEYKTHFSYKSVRKDVAAPNTFSWWLRLWVEHKGASIRTVTSRKKGSDGWFKKYLLNELGDK